MKIKKLKEKTYKIEKHKGKNIEVKDLMAGIRKVVKKESTNDETIFFKIDYKELMKMAFDNNLVIKMPGVGFDDDLVCLYELEDELTFIDKDVTFVIRNQNQIFDKENWWLDIANDHVAYLYEEATIVTSAVEEWNPYWLPEKACWKNHKRGSEILNVLINQNIRNAKLIIEPKIFMKLKDKLKIPEKFKNHFRHINILINEKEKIKELPCNGWGFIIVDKNKEITKFKETNYQNKKYLSATVLDLTWPDTEPKINEHFNFINSLISNGMVKIIEVM